MISNPRIDSSHNRTGLYEYWKSCSLVGLVDNKTEPHAIVTEREIFENVNRILSFGTSCKVKYYINYTLFYHGECQQLIEFLIKFL